jgi:cell wall-associated NlpC family hydrolase
MYDNYRHLLGRKYVDGKQDCYGLAQGYFQDVHNLPLVNFARPTQFWEVEGYDLIHDLLPPETWKSVGLNVRNLQIGDGLIFALYSKYANHLGVYVGNGMFIHHQYGRFSKEENLSGSWTSRLLLVVRHKELKLQAEKVDLITLLPNHVKRTLRIDT